MSIEEDRHVHGPQTEERHVYEAVEMLGDGEVLHLRCPECGKEVVRTRPAPGATSSRGYQVLRDENGVLLQGDFSARHSWAINMTLDDPGLVLP